MKRRDFVKLIGLASGASVAAACNPHGQAEKLIPYLVPPETEAIPGKSYYYPTTCTECPAGCGVLVRVRDGVPVKLEGVPGHPVNDGGLCLRGQAAIARLHDPGRLLSPLIKRSGNFEPIGWNEALHLISGRLQEPGSKYYLSGKTTGTLSALVDEFCSRLKLERLPEFETCSYAAIAAANQILFNRKEIPQYHIDQCDFLLTIGADILETHVNPVGFASRLTQARKNPAFDWHHLEPHLSLTGLNADQRLVINPDSETYLLLFILQQLSSSVPLPDLAAVDMPLQTGLTRDILNRLVVKLKSAKNPLLITGGIASTVTTQVLTGLIQHLTRMTGTVVDFSEAINDESLGQTKPGQSLIPPDAGVLFLVDVDLPASFRGKGRFTVGLSDTLTPTAQECDIILPLSHSLESWGDARARNGLLGLIQPVRKPAAESRSAGDILLQIMNVPAGPGAIPTHTYQEYVYSRWLRKYGKDFIDDFLAKGFRVEPGTVKSVTLQSTAVTAFLKKIKLPETMSGPVLVIAPSVRTFAGRGHKPQLADEIPDPLTTITYGDTVSISAGTAAKLGITTGTTVLIAKADKFSYEVSAMVQPQLPDDILLLHRADEGFRLVNSVSVFKTSSYAALPILSGSISQEGKGIIPYPVSNHPHHKKESLYPELQYNKYRWAMVIDLKLCNGCSACVAACYIENNIPLVGSAEHVNGREMSWLRIEPYYDKPDGASFVPMLCQQCGSAPCESVCPVYASYHNPEGLNAQIYNRCVGTRYCANNCPYKVRRFNWFNNQGKLPMSAVTNPDVSVRSKGIMEKCTFCIQRIRGAKDQAKDESRNVNDRDFTTACSQTCPAKAITFGNMLDSESKVYKLLQSEAKRVYRIFENLGTNPSVYYLTSTVTDE